jgi:spermidine synthase
VIVERRRTDRGELVLRRAGRHYEIISNGVFLMDTRGGESERLLVRAPLERVNGPAEVLIGGLGVGFSLAEALRGQRVTRVDVVECEPAVIAWHTTHLAAFSAGAITDPRVRLVTADLVAWLREGAGEGTGACAGHRTRDLAGHRTGDHGPSGADRVGAPFADTAATADPPGTYDVICVDIDNGPDWTVTDANAALYAPEGLELLCGRLRPGGAVAVWSAAESPAFEDRLRAHFTAIDVHRVTVPRGEPDVVYVATKEARP